MTQIDITTPAIIARCEHIEHCALGGSHKDAQRMRALAADRDQALARERALLDSNQEARDFLKERDTLRRERDEARNTALEEACAVVDAHGEYDRELCCDGRECGCQGASVHDAIKHHIRALAQKEGE